MSWECAERISAFIIGHWLEECNCKKANFSVRLRFVGQEVQLSGDCFAESFIIAVAHQPVQCFEHVVGLQTPAVLLKSSVEPAHGHWRRPRHVMKHIIVQLVVRVDVQAIDEEITHDLVSANVPVSALIEQVLVMTVRVNRRRVMLSVSWLAFFRHLKHHLPKCASELLCSHCLFGEVRQKTTVVSQSFFVRMVILSHPIVIVSHLWRLRHLILHLDEPLFVFINLLLDIGVATALVVEVKFFQHVLVVGRQFAFLNAHAVLQHHLKDALLG